MLFRFDTFEVDTDRFELRQDGAVVHVEPKVFRLITHLIENAERVVGVDELIANVWSGRIVSETTVAGCVKHARKALGDSGGAQRRIKTVRGLGFRFVAELQPDSRVDTDEMSSSVSRRNTTEQRLPSSGKASRIDSDADPSLLILPFGCLGDSPRCQSLSIDLAASLGRILSRIPLLKISAQTYRSNADTVYSGVRAIHDHNGVDYVIEGSLKGSEGELVIDARLSDARSGFAVWADSFTFEDSPALTLDQVVLAIINRVEPKLARAIYDRVRSRDGKPNARSLYLEANGLLSLKGWHYQSFPVARDLLRQSRQLSPEFAHASGFLSFVLGLGNCLGILDDRDRNHDEALEAAENALLLESQESAVLSLTGCALADLGYPARALPILQHAVDLNNANAQAWAALGSVCISQRRLDAAVENLRHGMNISPLDTRLAFWGSVLSTALRLHGRYNEARAEAELACRREYTAYWPRVALAAAHYRGGDRTGALAALNDAYRAKADLTPQQLRYLVGWRLSNELLALRKSPG